MGKRCRKLFCRVIGRLRLIFTVREQVPDLFLRNAAAKENTAVVLPIELTQIGGVSTFHHQHKPR